MSESVTILTVDDNDALRYFLARTLTAAGYRVIEARNGTEALAMAASSPDLITLDLNLPDFDGFEVCRRLRANPATTHIPILHISATFVEPEHRVRGLEGGADAYLAEPVEGDELLATVGALLRMKRAEREARLQAAEAKKAREELKKAHDDLELRVSARTAELAEKSTEIRQLTGRLLRLQDDERRHLARELHDSTGQMLVVMKLKLDLMQTAMKDSNPTVTSLASQCVEINEELSRQLRTMSYLLHPPLLDEAGLSSALRWYAEGFSQRSGIDVNLKVDANLGRLKEDLEIALFRVVQESLTNIHRHSENKKATIRLTRSVDGLLLEIVDEGAVTSNQAHQEQTFRPGVGMMGMQERMRRFGSTLDVKRTETGVTVSVLVLPDQAI